MVLRAVTTLALRSGDEEQARRHRNTVPRSWRVLATEGPRAGGGPGRGAILAPFGAHGHHEPPTALVLDHRRLRERGADVAGTEIRDVDDCDAEHTDVTSVSVFAGHDTIPDVSCIVKYDGHIRTNSLYGGARGRSPRARLRQHRRRPV